MATYNMQCPMAATRLIHKGMPATREHEVRLRPDQSSSSAIAVAETVQVRAVLPCWGGGALAVGVAACGLLLPRALLHAHVPAAWRLPGACLLPPPPIAGACRHIPTPAPPSLP